MTDFENTVLKGGSQFYDVDELEVIIDYYFEVNDLVPLGKAVDYGLYLYPDNTDMRIRHAHLLFAREKFDEALKELQLLRQVEPENTDIAYSLGMVYSAMGDSQQSLSFFKEAEADGWMLGRLYANMAEEYYKLKDYDKALSYYERALQSDSFDDITLYNYYDFCFEIGREETGAEVLKRFVMENPYNKVGWYCLGGLYRALSLMEKACDAFEYALAIDKSFVEGYIALSQTQDMMGQYGDAVTTLLRAVEFCDDHARIYRTVGSIFARESNFDTAQFYFRKAIEADPCDAEAYASRAVCFSQQGDMNEALSDVKKALALQHAIDGGDMEKGSAEVYCSAGMVYDMLDDFEKASEYFENMIACPSCDEPKCQFYTQFLFDHGVYDILIQFGEESLALYPHNAFYSTFMAAAYFKTNRYNKCRKMLPDCLPFLLHELCPQLMEHPLLGPLVPTQTNMNTNDNKKTD